MTCTKTYEDQKHRELDVYENDQWQPKFKQSQAMIIHELVQTKLQY